MKQLFFCLVLPLTLLSCGTDNTQAPVLTSLLGKEYFEPQRSAQVQARLDSNLRVAQANFDADPSEENYIWLGRRQAYLMHLQEAVATFTEGLQKYPESYRLLRHRGHRHISLRQFDKAAADLQRASELMQGKPLETEPDGQPNAVNKPLSNIQFNVWYHLALAHYLNGNLAGAERAYLECLKVSDNDDLLVATADWLYMTLRREGKTAEAAQVLMMVTDTMNIVENDSYYLRLKMYQGRIPADSLLAVGPGNPDPDLALATQGYGVGNWYLYNRDTARALEVYNQVLAGKHFSAFGFIAAEADMVRLQK
jgi:tetratricopeptide (TPR) repeat protein